MCGIAGIWAPGGGERDTLLSVARLMTGALRHRGPDGSGHWCSEDDGIVLGHRRLSIIDLSPQGSQPMTSADGRWIVVFNGEIYNFEELRRELEMVGVASWRGTSDTEVLLAAISRWGLAATLPRLVGMFSAALWDAQSRMLHLFRDRMGEKPLYYGWYDGRLVFASELKALRADPGWRGEVDRRALALYMRYSYVPEPYSIYRGIRKLPPGTLLSSSGAGEVAPVPFWSPLIAYRAAAAARQTVDPQESVTRLEELVSRAVAGQMVADVPVGAFLSGGVDSSLIVALMQAQSSRRVRTFTIGFEEKEFDEADYARDVAKHLGTEHTELYVSPRETLDVIPALPSIYDEPFGDPSQIPTVLVCRMARQHVTVCLSGDGGDELFGGYSRYLQAAAQWDAIGRWPAGLRRSAGTLLPPLGPRLEKFREVADCRDRRDLYQRLVSACREPGRLVPDAAILPTFMTDRSVFPPGTDYRDEMMWIDTVSYLPGDILAKVDRAGMSVSLETRIPLLDHRVVEFAWTMSPALKWHDGSGKWPLRELLCRHVPKTLIDRPKRGFGVPIDRWLRGELRDWAQDLLSPAHLGEESLLDGNLVRQRWREHLEGRRDRSYYLWNILMYQAWRMGQ